VFICVYVIGVASEGLYRVAGFHDDVEAIKMAFDKGDTCDCISVVKYFMYVTAVVTPKNIIMDNFDHFNFFTPRALRS